MSGEIFATVVPAERLPLLLTKHWASKLMTRVGFPSSPPLQHCASGPSSEMLRNASRQSSRTP